MKVLIADKTAPECARRLREFPGLQVVDRAGMSPEALVAEIGDYEGLVVRSASKVTSAVIEAGKKLRVVGRAGAGVDNVDVAAATARGIVVMNTPGGNAAAVAELVVGMMFALARRLTEMDAAMKAKRWEKKSYLGRELRGKTLGIVGIGQVGGRVAALARGLGMEVLACDPYVSAARAEELGCRPVELDGLLARADFVSIHVPKDKGTTRWIDRAMLSRMKKGAFLINCARGGIVVEEDLLAALDSGQVAGAGLDVFEREPPEDFRLAAHPKVVATPHIGASTEEAQVAVAVMIADQVGRCLTRGEIVNAVNR